MATVLVIDDDPALAEMLGIVLRDEQLIPVFCADGAEAVAVFRATVPDLVLLDLMLPGCDGVTVCEAIREESGVPIVMLTARGDTNDVVTGLEAGADDYIIKPFKPSELMARIRARLRRGEDLGPRHLSVGHVHIDVDGHVVTRDGVAVSLTPLEFDLLVTMARRPWHVFTRDQLLNEVWGYRHPADTRLVNVHIQRLRSKIEHDPDHPQVILTVRGVGYRAGTT